MPDLVSPLIIIIITYTYNMLNDTLSASRTHNKLKTILSKYIHIQIVLVYLQSYLYIIIKHTHRLT